MKMYEGAKIAHKVGAGSKGEGAGTPTALHPPPPSVQTLLCNTLDHVKKVQVCESCIKSLKPEDGIIHLEECLCMCDCACQVCINMGNVCETCVIKWITETDSSLRPCAKCIESDIKCKTCIVLTLWPDCEPRSKNGMHVGHINSKQTKHSLPACLSFLHHIPDCVHIVKLLKSSFANWYLIVDGERCNLSLVRNLCEDSLLGPSLCKVLTLDSVRHRDRMSDVTPIMLSNASVLKQLGTVKTAVHSLVSWGYMRMTKKVAYHLQWVMCGICLSWMDIQIPFIPAVCTTQYKPNNCTRVSKIKRCVSHL